MFAERAAWSFVEAERPNFSLAVICNTYTFGPIQPWLSHVGDMNTSNERIRDIVQGKMKSSLAPTAPVFTWVDVRDVARAHVQAMTAPQAGGKRFYVIAGFFSNKRIADIVRASYPELASELPPADSVDDMPDELFRFDNTRSRELLGLHYTSLEKSVCDTVDSILALSQGPRPNTTH